MKQLVALQNSREILVVMWMNYSGILGRWTDIFVCIIVVITVSVGESGTGGHTGGTLTLITYTLKATLASLDRPNIWIIES